MSIQGGELALGKDLLVAFMPWAGYNFEDAIIISRQARRRRHITSCAHCGLHDQKFAKPNLDPEIVTRDIPNVSEDALRHLDEDGIVRIGAEVHPGDILVGKITPKGEQELSAKNACSALSLVKKPKKSVTHHSV
jgi:DNA-directed RNA polymerase subunit beta